MRFGAQVDTQAIADVGGGITSRNVARYIAKDVTKGGEITGLPPRRIKNLDALRHSDDLQQRIAPGEFPPGSRLPVVAS
jgi:hypothetical protein